MIKGFRDFIVRGNVIDLAVAFVIGAAFTALVTSFTSSLIQPLINLALGGGVDGGKIVVSGQVFDLGAILNSSITFLITAAVVYFIFVLPMNAWKSQSDTDEKQEPEVEEEIALLREIRDSLVAGANGTGGTTRAAKDPQD
ncbi:MAG: large conductance mechanosensitive channel [Actinomycetes bacterium]|jgi:large conductance mechanosensitive channel